MKTLVRIFMVAVVMAVLCGCRTSAKPISLGGPSEAAMASAAAPGDMTEAQPNRMVVWKAHLSMDVWNTSNAVAAAMAVAEKSGGYLEQRVDGETSASITLRIPAKAFHAAIGSFEKLGTVTFRNLQGEDVTEQYIDVEARLKNKIVLRDRLKQLLDKAADVKDVLAIETELNRVQSDVDSMEGRIKFLKGQVDFATVSLGFQRKSIPGPLGYLFKGLWWGVEKLFVIRE